MPRGKPSVVGETRVAQNGYHYTKCEDGWRLTHHIIAEQTLERPLHEHERAFFADGDRTNLKPSNIKVERKTTAALRKRVTEIDKKMQELIYEKAQLQKQIRAIEAK